MNSRLFLILFCVVSKLIAQKAVCSVPVADLVGEPLSENFYKHLPINGDDQAVKRIGQLLFNEIVEIIDENEKEAHIQVLNHFYCTYTDKQPRTEYWTLKKNLTPISEIEDLNVLSQPLSYKQKNNQPAHLITLQKPFFDYKNHRLYSAGTRFLCSPSGEDNNNDNSYYYVYTLSPQFKKTTIKIPRNICITFKHSPDEQIRLFIETLRKLASCSQGKIPYVLGGMSYAREYKKGCIEKTINIGDQKTHIFQTKEHIQGPHTGFDCAGLIFRAAQIAGLPFYTKNTSAMKHHLRPLKSDEEIENGDIIFIPGHVIAIVDKENNRVVEARTQSHGYGFVHEIDLNLLFKEIESFDDLRKFHFSEEKASRLDRNGQIIAHKPITILKIKSIFE